MISILEIKFNAVVSYQDWTVFTYKGKYYVVNEEEIIPVVLDKKVKVDKTVDVVDLGCDYNGQSDDFQYYLGFNKV